jgi:ATP-dependent Clp protease ATP-binding subunit ClpA
MCLSGSRSGSAGGRARTGEARELRFSHIGTEALDLGNDYVGTEHVLLALAGINEGVAIRVLRSFNVTAGQVRDEVVRSVPDARVRRLPQSRRRAGWRNCAGA